VVFPEGFPLSQILPKEFTMLSNEVFALACRAYYDEVGLVVDEKNGQFAHCPYPKGMGETGYYLLWEHHQQQGLLQSRDVGKRCFFTSHPKKWLVSCDPLPDNYFDLWDIYEEFTSGKHNPMFGRTGELHPSYGKTGELSSCYGRVGELHPLYGRRGELSPNYGRKRPDLSERNRSNSGESSPMWGKKRPEHSLMMKSKVWWVRQNGDTCRSAESPGPEWKQGRKWK
jgi:hypothetical protein